MKIISISSRKGGVGKTTISYNLAHILAKNEHKVLLLDMDSQASLTSVLGMPFHHQIYDVLTGRCSMQQAIKQHSKHLHFVPTSQDLENIDLQFSNIQGREHLLKDALVTIKDIYDYVVIDTSPSTNLSLLNSLVASTQVIVPVNADYLAFDGLQKFVEVIDKVKADFNSDLQFRGIVINSKRNSNHSREVVRLLKERYKNNVIAELNMSVVMMDSIVENLPLFVHSPNHLNTTELDKLYQGVIK